jgi:hypothetical protein
MIEAVNAGSADVCWWQILLQKSFRTGGQKFFGPLMRF